MMFRDQEELRAIAEERLEDEGGAPGAHQPGDLRREIRVHEIELELQNESLRSTRAELEEALERYRCLFERSPMAYLVLDEDDRILVANQTACTLVGRRRVELEGCALSGLLLPDDRDELHRLLRRTRRSGERERAEVRARGPSDEVMTLVADAIEVRDEASGASRLRVALVDFTEQRRLEQHLERIERLGDLGAFASGVAHDFNNHLSIILSNCALLLETAGLEGEARHRVEEVQRTGRASAALTTKILAYGRGQEPFLEPVDLASRIGQSLDTISGLLGEEITVQLEVRSPGEDAWALVDPDQLHQLVLNLATNARDAMPGGGVLTISIEAAEVGPQDGEVAPGEYRRVCFQDTGGGIPPDDLTRIFQPFFTTKPDGAGTGLGLATIRAILDRCGGAVRVSSEVGTGTSVAFLLPAARPQRARCPAGAGESEPGDAGGLVLLVEDHPDLLEVSRRLLAHDGFEVLACRDADAALEAFAARGVEIGVLYTDLSLPGMSGRELAARLRSQRPGLPVLFTSGHPRDLVPVEVSGEAATAFLQKPAPPGKVYQVLRRLLLSA